MTETAFAVIAKGIIALIILAIFGCLLYLDIYSKPPKR
jgi:hypothetical protein